MLRLWAKGANICEYHNRIFCLYLVQRHFVSWDDVKLAKFLREFDSGARLVCSCTVNTHFLFLFFIFFSQTRIKPSTSSQINFNDKLYTTRNRKFTRPRKWGTALRLLTFHSLYKFDKFFMSKLSLNFFPNETLDKLTTFCVSLNAYDSALTLYWCKFRYGSTM